MPQTRENDPELYQVIETDCGPIEYARIGEGYPVLVVQGDMGGFDQGLMLVANSCQYLSRIGS